MFLRFVGRVFGIVGLCGSFGFAVCGVDKLCAET